MGKCYVCACQWSQSMPGHLTLHQPLHTCSRARYQQGVALAQLNHMCNRMGIWDKAVASSATLELALQALAVLQQH